MSSPLADSALVLCMTFSQVGLLAAARAIRQADHGEDVFSENGG